MTIEISTSDVIASQCQTLATLVMKHIEGNGLHPTAIEQLSFGRSDAMTSATYHVDTDFWQAYRAVFPSQRHRSVGQENGQTNHIERFNCTLRQRVSRLVRKTLSFSKKLENHIGAIWFFIHHYNASLPL